MSFDKLLESGRLVFRPVDTSYCTANYLLWMNDQEVTRYMEVFGDYSKEDLKKYLLTAEKNKTLLFWAIHIKENNKHIGNIKIDPINRHHGFGEYGIMMGDKSEWGNGYAEEATKAIIDYCFKEQGLRKIVLGVVEDNLPAVRLYKKLGFVTEGVYKDHGKYDGRYCNILRMAIFNSAV
jgi:RimJ/RimL family protein N-acetyltransferase